MGFDEIISYLGEFGRYQKRIYFLLCLPAITSAFHKLGNVFLIAEPDYRCKLPEEQNNASYGLDFDTLQENYPWDGSHKKFSSCELLVNNKSKACSEYIFDQSVYGYTAAVEWNLTCDRSFVIANGNSLFMVGVMIGSIIFGEMSDRYGRKLTFFISLVLQVVFGLLAVFAPEFWSFTAARLVIGATTSGVFLVAYVIALEMVGPKHRPTAGTFLQMFFSLGYMLTALFAYYIENWRYLQLAITLPGVAFFTYWWFIPESIRWLIAKNKAEEAKVIIKIAAKENKITIDEETLNNLVTNKDTTSKTEESAPSMLDALRYPNLRKRTIILFFDWFANNITYYGLSWNTNNLAGNPYLNFVISGAVEIPAYTAMLLTLNRWGRKRVLASGMILAGIALLLTIVVPHSEQWLVVTLAMMGKLAITMSYGTVYVFSTELFPTVIRNSGLGACSTLARVGAITAPFINFLSKVWKPLPMVIFGSLAFAGGLLSLLLPETLNKKLPETIQDGEQFGKKPDLNSELSNNENNGVELQNGTKS